MSEPSLQRHFSYKHIVYLNLLIILWKSGSDCKFQATAAFPDLPSSEVSSLITITRQFKSKVTYTFTTSYCQNQISNYGVSIKCTQSCYVNGSTDCHIMELVLSTMGLSGTIDAAVGDLLYLTTIIVSNNKLQGSIPASLGNLMNLTTLDLSNNQLTGTIPDSLGNLGKLQWLYLQRNFLQGSIPSSLGQVTNLIELNLEFNMLTGSIPDELGSLSNLQFLNLAENRLSGSLPSSLANLTWLSSLWVVSNYFTGILPDSYAQLRNLRWFGVAGNELSGPLPLYVKDWLSIQSLAFQGNNFEGPLPPEYFTLLNLQHLLVTDLNTDYPFQLPPSTNFSKIYTLILRNCSIIGSIPKYIGELSFLKHLDLSFNGLTGGILESMRPNLNYISLARNNLDGAIPKWIFQASETRVDLSYNNFSEMKSPVPNGQDLNLFACCCCQSSQTTEPFMLQPDQMMKAYIPGKWKPKFYSLFINSGGEQTTFNGKTYEADNETSPFHVSPLRNWAYSFSGDFLVVTANSSDYTKRVPCKISNSDPSLFEEARLSPVALTYHGFSLINGPYNVTLQFAEIVYVDDADYNGLRKRLFDVYIQGKRELKDFNIIDQAGRPNKAINMTFPTHVNDNLLTIHLFWAGKGSFANSPAFNGPLISAISVHPLFKVGSNKLRPLYKALISVASLVMALLLVLAFTWAMGWLEDKELQEKVKVGQLMETKVMTTEQKQQDNYITIPLKEITKATKNFSDANCKLGNGFLGTVFKAELNKDRNITVAVKKLSPDHKGKVNELIKQEIFNLTSLEHENLIRMWDYHGGKRHQLLVYEYMEKKSLSDVLIIDSKEKLTWKIRFGICLGVARGLEFLHKHSRFNIVHGNIKSSNILLHGNFQPKLSDFGLTNVCTDEDQPMIIKREAPKGYLAPEYCRLGSPTRETDIFSFGVLLLEIVCSGNNKVIEANKDLDWAHKYSKSGNNLKLQSMFEGQLQDNTVEENEEAINVLHLAVMCTDMSPSRRPTITQILSFLTGNKTIEAIKALRQAIDASNKEDKSFAEEKNKVSTSKETTSNSSTSTGLIEYMP